jgi:response regulator of citrate/malate metabolism
MAFTILEKDIVKVLRNEREPLHTADVARKTGICWVTARKHLIKIHKTGLIQKKQNGRAVCWYLKK